MNFKDTQSIYLQIGDYVCEQILIDTWKEEERIPSVRELAVSLQVNPNTVVRAYEYLLSNEIIFNKRGIGYFVESDAKIKIMNYLRKQFLEQELPFVFKNMDLLNMSIEDVKQEYESYKKSE